MMSLLYYQEDPKKQMQEYINSLKPRDYSKFVPVFGPSVAFIGHFREKYVDNINNTKKLKSKLNRELIAFRNGRELPQIFFKIKKYYRYDVSK